MPASTGVDLAARLCCYPGPHSAPSVGQGQGVEIAAPDGPPRGWASGDTLGVRQPGVLPMKHFKPSSRISILPMLLSAILAAGLSTQAASQRPTDPAAGVWKMTKVVSVDACNACVQAR